MRRPMLITPFVSAAPVAATPHIFAPNTISSGASDSAPTFSVDGNELFFERSNGQRYAIMSSHRTGATWSKPKVASFSGQWLDLESALSANGAYLIFSSNRPAGNSKTPIDGFYYGKPQIAKGGALWRVDRIHGTWGRPYRLPETVNISNSIYEPSLASNGDLYFQSADADGKQFHLYVARATRHGYLKAQRLDLDGPPDSSDMDPAVAPDGSFLIFSSDRQSAKDHQLFISFWKGKRWSEPRLLGPDVNNGSVGDPRIDLKERRLYFASRRLAPPSGNGNADMQAAAQWNNGLSNIWFIHFDPSDWRSRAAEGSD